jgi:hypothetical protein
VSVLAFVPEDGTNRFFVISQQKLNALIAEELKRLGRPNDYPITGVLWSTAERHENKWDILPRRAGGIKCTASMAIMHRLE